MTSTKRNYYGDSIICRNDMASVIDAINILFVQYEETKDELKKEEINLSPISVKIRLVTIEGENPYAKHAIQNIRDNVDGNQALLEWVAYSI